MTKCHSSLNFTLYILIDLIFTTPLFDPVSTDEVCEIDSRFSALGSYYEVAPGPVASDSTTGIVADWSVCTYNGVTLSTMYSRPS